MTWSATWQCGAEPGDNGFAARMMMDFLAPGPAATPHCADVGGTSFILDVTNPAARAWWRDQVAAFVQRYGIDGIKLDRGEEHIPSAATDIWADGRTGREVHNAPRRQATSLRMTGQRFGPQSPGDPRKTPGQRAPQRRHLPSSASCQRRIRYQSRTISLAPH